jgi:hypothetical protein
LGATAEENLDAHLIKSHQGAQPHTAGNQLGDAIVGKVLNRRHAAALLVRYIGDHFDIGNRSIVGCHHSIEITIVCAAFANGS